MRVKVMGSVPKCCRLAVQDGEERASGRIPVTWTGQRPAGEEGSPAVPSLRTLQGARGGVYRGFDGDDDRSWRWIRVPQQEWRGGRNSDALTMQTASDDIRIGFDEQRKRLCTGRGSQFDFDEAIAALLLLAAQPQRGPLEFFDGRLGDKVLSGAAQDECRKRLLLRSITESSPCPFVDRCIGRAPDRFSQFRVEGIKEMVLSRAFSIERPKQGGARTRQIRLPTQARGASTRTRGHCQACRTRAR